MARSTDRKERRLARPGPDAIVYLKERGIRCVATDAPDWAGSIHAEP